MAGDDNEHWGSSCYNLYTLGPYSGVLCIAFWLVGNVETVLALPLLFSRHWQPKQRCLSSSVTSALGATSGCGQGCVPPDKIAQQQASAALAASLLSAKNFCVGW